MPPNLSPLARLHAEFTGRLARPGATSADTELDQLRAYIKYSRSEPERRPPPGRGMTSLPTPPRPPPLPRPPIPPSAAMSRAELETLVGEAAARHGVRPDILLALARVESGFNPTARSPVGALGVMQVMPKTARGMLPPGSPEPNLFDPKLNIDLGAQYLRQMLDRFNNNYSLALAAYNAGPEAVNKYGGIPPYPAVHAYLKAVFESPIPPGLPAQDGMPVPPMSPERPPERPPEPPLVAQALPPEEFAEGGLVEYDRAVVARLAQELVKGFEEGGEVVGPEVVGPEVVGIEPPPTSEGATAPSPEMVAAKEILMPQRFQRRTLDDMAGKYGLANVGDYLSPIFRGGAAIPGTVMDYIKDVATGPKPLDRLGGDISTFGRNFWEGVKSDPVGAVLDFTPIVGEVRSAMDAKKFRDEAAAAALSGDKEKASTYGQLAALATAGAVPFFGMGLRGAGRGVKAGVEGAEKSVAAAVPAYTRQLSPLGFYSHGAETAANLPQAKGTPEQFRAMLEKYGVKSAEMEGFDAAFSGRPSVTREELAQHFNERRPQVEETVLGFNQNEVKAARERAESAGNNWDELGPVSQGRYIRSVSGRSLTDYGTDPKFHNYTLPGGENYREVLLKLPNPGDALDARRLEIEKIGAAATPEQRQEWADIMNRLRPDSSDVEGVQKYKNFPEFRGPHWDDPNILAHLRMADRKGPNNEKILHLEELQSDWGKKGRKEGFKQQPDPAKETPLMEAKQDAQFAWEKARSDFLKGHEDYQKTLQDQTMRMAERWGLTPEEIAADHAKGAQEWANMTPSQKLSHAQSEFMRSENPTASPHYAQRDAEVAAAQERDRTRNALFAYQKSIDTGTPTAPYVTNTAAWTDLALKRALKEAAEGGYDRLVWTPGVEQAKRYDLSKQVRTIEYSPNADDGTYHVKAVSTRGEYVPISNAERMTLDDIERTVGKEIAEKIKTGEGSTRSFHRMRVLEGLDLQVGGEGMKAYYDKMVPNQLSKLVKRLDPDAKVGLTDVMLPQVGSGMMGHNNPPFAAPGLTITPKMREAIMKGQTDFAEGGLVEHDPAVVDRLAQGLIAGYQEGGEVEVSADTYDPAAVSALADRLVKGFGERHAALPSPTIIVERRPEQKPAIFIGGDPTYKAKTLADLADQYALVDPFAYRPPDVPQAVYGPPQQRSENDRPASKPGALSRLRKPPQADQQRWFETNQSSGGFAVPFPDGTFNLMHIEDTPEAMGYRNVSLSELGAGVNAGPVAVNAGYRRIDPSDQRSIDAFTGDASLARNGNTVGVSGTYSPEQKWMNRVGLNWIMQLPVGRIGGSVGVNPNDSNVNQAARIYLNLPLQGR